VRSHQREWRRRKEQPVYLVQVCVEKLPWRKGFIPLLIFWGSLYCLFKVHIGGLLSTLLVKKIMFYWSLGSRRELVVYSSLIFISESFYWKGPMNFSSILRLSQVKSCGVCWFFRFLFYAFFYFAYYLFREDLIWILLPRLVICYFWHLPNITLSLNFKIKIFF